MQFLGPSRVHFPTNQAVLQLEPDSKKKSDTFPQSSLLDNWKSCLSNFLRTNKEQKFRKSNIDSKLKVLKQES